MEALFNGFVAVLTGEQAQEEVEAMKMLLRLQEEEILDVVHREMELQKKYDLLVSERKSDVLEQDAFWKTVKEADKHIEWLELELEEVQVRNTKLIEDLYSERRYWIKERAYFKEKAELRDLELQAAAEREESLREKYDEAVAYAPLPSDVLDLCKEMEEKVRLLEQKLEEKTSQLSDALDRIDSLTSFASYAPSDYGIETDTNSLEELKNELKEKNFELIDAHIKNQELEEQLVDYKNYWEKRVEELEQERYDFTQSLPKAFRVFNDKNCKLQMELFNVELQKKLYKEQIEECEKELSVKTDVIGFLEMRLNEMAAMQNKPEADQAPIGEENVEDDIIAGTYFENVDFSGFTTFFH